MLIPFKQFVFILVVLTTKVRIYVNNLFAIKLKLNAQFRLERIIRKPPTFRNLPGSRFCFLSIPTVVS